MLPGGPAIPAAPPAAAPVDGFAVPPAAAPDVVPVLLELPLLPMLLELPLVPVLPVAPACAIAADPKASRPAKAAAVT